MKFKTRLQVTFATIVLLPLAMTALAFLIIGGVLSYGQQMGGAPGYASISDTVQAISEETETLFKELLFEKEVNPTILEDKQYLQRKNDELGGRTAFILVRKENDIYYAGNMNAAKDIFPKLPDYGNDDSNNDRGYYYAGIHRYVKQMDFTFADGSKGSLFVITGIGSLISKTLLLDMFIAIVAILLFTSFMMTRNMQKGVLDPINQLNIAMKKIKDGNFDYMLATDQKGEMGDLYRNYEDMRLRLKESAEEKIQQENKNRELVSNISHDLKTPITAIKGYMEGIMDGVADTPEKMDKYIRTVYSKANDMDKLINELTLYSGIDSNRIPYNFHRINVADYFGDCVEEVGLDLDSRGIELNYSNLVDPDTVIIADPEQMKKVINNIIGNSVKYMDKAKGIIDIRILDEVDSVRIEIEDNGKGISAKDLPNIFERFYRTDASRNSSKGGSGIGLSIVKKIIEDHGGYIWATSKENEGTCMHFVIRKYKELQNEVD